MYFEIPDNELEGLKGIWVTGFEEIPDDTDTGIDEYGKKYARRKRKFTSIHSVLKPYQVIVERW